MDETKTKYMEVLSMLNNVMILLDDENNEIAYSTIDMATDKIKDLMYSDPRC